MNKKPPKSNGHVTSDAPHLELEVPLLILTQSPTQTTPDGLAHHQHIDVGFLGEELLSEEEEEFEETKEFRQKSKELEMKV